MRSNKLKIKSQSRKFRQRRIRARIAGTSQRPRLSVFRSLKHLSAQLIDDQASRTLLAVNDLAPQSAQGDKPIVRAFKLGELLAKKALEHKINSVVFDRSGYKYHGLVKALAEGARQAGLKF